MSKKKLELSRRKTLAALGTIGAASAGAGLGTTALFNDRETFENNRMVAGSLDLKVDWEEHYNYPQVYGFGDPTVDDQGNSLDVSSEAPQSNADEYTALPDPANPMLWVHNSDISTYMDNTAIEAYPDVDDDGVQDAFGQNGVSDFCTDGADMSEDLDPTGFRTDNEDTNDDGESKPLVSLNDVKPGDFGELTLSLHLCDNPGFIWMNGELVEAAENGNPEPEEESSDSGPENEEVDSLGQSDQIELLDEVQTVLWQDGDCNNILNGGGKTTDGEKADVVIVMDRSGSMDGQLSQAQAGANALVDALGPNDQVGLVSFSSSSTFDPTDASTLDAGLTTNHNSVQTAINNLSTGGLTNMEAAVERAHEELLSTDVFPSHYGNSSNARPGARKIMVVLGDGQPNSATDVTDSTNDSPIQEATNAKSDGIEIFTISYAGGPSTLLGNMASDPSSNPASQYAYVADVSDIVTVFQNIGGSVSSGGETVIKRGTLRELLTDLEAGDGIALDGEPGTSGRTCFAGQQTHCVGLAWWVPKSVENEIQTDSVNFDIGFYTEQCRHNEAAGNNVVVGNNQ